VTLLEPSLVIILGDKWRALQTRIKRWFEPRIETAFEVLAFESAQDFKESVRTALSNLRSARLIGQLQDYGYIPQGHFFRNLRVLLICDHNDIEGLKRVRATVADCLEQQPFGAAVNRIFWVIAFGPDTIEEIASNDAHIHEPFGHGEGCVLFHILPYWRAIQLNLNEQAAIAERLAVLLLKMDMSPETRLVQLLAPSNQRSWLTGIEGHLLHKHDDTVREAMGRAIVNNLRKFFTGQPRTPIILRRLIRESIESFETDALVDPNTTLGREVLERYRTRYVPALLERLAPYADGPEDFLYLLREVEHLGSKSQGSPSMLVAATPAWSALLTSPRIYAALIAILILIGAAVAMWRKRRSPSASTLPPVPDQELPKNEAFHAALQEFIGTLAEFRSPNEDVRLHFLIRPQIYRQLAMDLESRIVTDTIVESKCSNELIETADLRIREKNFSFIQLLGSHWLRGDLIPSGGFEYLHKSLSHVYEELRAKVVSDWFSAAQQKHPTDKSQWQSYLFAPKPPSGQLSVHQMANLTHNPEHCGWYPDTWLHYLYLVECH